jgi:hypothetical protein
MPDCQTVACTDGAISIVAALPNPEVLDGLSAEILVDVATRAAALHARAMANLATINRSWNAAKPSAAEGDQLTAVQVAAMLNAKVGWVYRHWKRIGGVKLDGLLRFQRRRVASYVERMAR